MKMGERLLMKGTEALAEAAIQAGCRYFFGYPITPQNEVPEYMSRRMPKVGGVFLQAESEVAAINMVYGAAAAGARVMTSSSSPGISLKQEGISYIAAAELPCVIVNIVRGGPGLGGIQPAQSDYFQATKGGGHGDYRLIVLAPSGVQEMVELMGDAFDLADLYRNPVMVIGDGILGQMMEPVEFKPRTPRELPPKDWALTGRKGKNRRIITSAKLTVEELAGLNAAMQAKYAEITAKETRYEAYMADDAELIIVAYGTMARVAKTAIKHARNEGIKLGLIRPITLWPFPSKVLNQAADSAKGFLTVEMSCGQMVEDVRLAVNGKKPVHFLGQIGGIGPTYIDVLAKVREILA